MKDPDFRYYVERKLTGKSGEPNLHIFPPKAYENWVRGTQQQLLSLLTAFMPSCEHNELAAHSEEDDEAENEERTGGIDLDKDTAELKTGSPEGQNALDEGFVSFCLGTKIILLFINIIGRQCLSFDKKNRQ